MEKWQDPKVIALWIAIALILVFTILLFVVKIMHAGYKRMTEANLREARMQLEHQKKLIETNLQAQEKERMRIASDLHDSLIGKLTVMRMKSQIGLPITEIDTMLGEGIAEARRISHDLTPPLLEHTPLQELIADLLNPWGEKLKIDYFSDVRHQDSLPVGIKIQVVRMIQELMTNINKHAKATEVKVHLRHTSNYLTLFVKDDGCGFDTSVLKKGLGLNSLEMRIQYLNAKYRVDSTIGKGTTTLFVVPKQQTIANG
ncbi:sensor histidine kinase [Flavobacterium arcticum]|uniref:histidine kinase n=1 Tax=Flavobacterium arcticum TaxID=1784713 RepID=A0A345H8L3_9FLAO|nr:sensor histidine kinase [Flavobacterium arcticum]AXG72923.1 sensor histidine kinase [Flavobacterium arcticum]KAF2510412.1 sensor histidine kinase [Flavobacterium arcticum]